MGLRGGQDTKVTLSGMVEALSFLLAVAVTPFPRNLMIVLKARHGNKNVNTCVSRLCKKGFIKSFKEKKGSFFQVVQERKCELLGNFVALKQARYKRPWDGKWRLVIYDIPEAQKHNRTYLRRLLQDLGFGKIQLSSWASPYDFSSLIYDAAKERNFTDYLCLYEGTFFAGMDIERLVKQAWPLDDLRERYESLLNRIDELRSVVQQKDIHSLIDNYAHVYQDYKELCQADPFLPNVFLNDWLYKEVEGEVHRVCKEIVPRVLSCLPEVR
jgi:phenylacetic acid degradation operon negative regulatory protein